MGEIVFNEEKRNAPDANRFLVHMNYSNLHVWHTVYTVLKLFCLYLHTSNEKLYHINGKNIYKRAKFLFLMSKGNAVEEFSKLKLNKNSL